MALQRMPVREACKTLQWEFETLRRRLRYGCALQVWQNVVHTS